MLSEQEESVDAEQYSFHVETVMVGADSSGLSPTDDEHVVVGGGGVGTSAAAAKERGAFSAYLHRMKGAGKTPPPVFTPTWDALPSGLFAAFTMLILAIIEAFGLQPLDKGLLSVLPSFGASCTMVMCLVTIPGAQPRALIMSHVVGAFLGVSWAHITRPLPLPLGQQIASAFAVAMLTVFMMVTGTLQPSASATTCVAAFHRYGVMRDQGYMFLVAPAALGSCTLVVCGWLLNNLVPWRRSYPLWL